MTQLTICLIIFVLTLVGFASGIVPIATTALAGMMLMVVTGCLAPQAALSGFGNSNTILMVSMFVVAAGLNKTQMVNKISAFISKISKGSVLKVTIGYVLLTCILAQFIPSAMVVFSIVFPMAAAVCKEMNYSPSKMMYALGITAIGTVVTSPMGGSITTFAEYEGFFQTYNYTAYNMTVMDIFWGRLPILIFIVIYAIFFAPKFSPSKPITGMIEEAAKNTKEQQPLKPFQEVVGYATFFSVLICLIFQSSLPISLSNWEIATIGAIVISATGILKGKELISSMNISMVLLYVGSLGIGNALTATGAGDIIGEAFSKVIGSTNNNYIIGFLFFIVPFILTQFMMNRSVHSIFIPIAILTCKAMGCNPIGPILLILTSTLTAFMTPMATPTVPMMMGAGGYDVKSLIKMSWLPAIGITIVSVGWIMTIYPLY